MTGKAKKDGSAGVEAAAKTSAPSRRRPATVPPLSPANRPHFIGE